MIIVEFDYLYFLSHELKIPLKDLDRLLFKSNPLIIHSEKAIIPAHYQRTFEYSSKEGYSYLSRLAQHIAKYDFDEITFITFPVISTHLFFDHIQTNKNITFATLTKFPLVGDSYQIEKPLYYLDHASEFLKYLTINTVSASGPLPIEFKSIDKSKLQLIEFININQKSRWFFTFKETDAVFLSTIDMIATPSCKEQDISIYLINNQFKYSENIFFKKDSVENIEELDIDFIFNNQLNVLSSSEKIKINETQVLNKEILDFVDYFQLDYKK